MRGATNWVSTADNNVWISIHAPHAGRDRSRGRRAQPPVYFNPRAPCGARPRLFSPLWDSFLFQSTRPMRGATWSFFASSEGVLPFQSTRPMRGATMGMGCGTLCPGISIHAPHAGRDAVRVVDGVGVGISIHAPHAGRDRNGGHGVEVDEISIHAPHAGRDQRRPKCL